MFTVWDQAYTQPLAQLTNSLHYSTPHGILIVSAKLSQLRGTLDGANFVQLIPLKYSLFCNFSVRRLSRPPFEDAEQVSSGTANNWHDPWASLATNSSKGWWLVGLHEVSRTCSPSKHPWEFLATDQTWLHWPDGLHWPSQKGISGQGSWGAVATKHAWRWWTYRSCWAQLKRTSKPLYTIRTLLVANCS